MVRISAAVIGTLAVIALAACSPVPAQSNNDAKGHGAVTLGLLAPLTGPAAADGKLMQQGAQLAVKELNADGGVGGRKVSLETSDVKDQKSATVATAVAKLTADSAVGAVITGYASTTNFEIDPLADAGMPYLIGGGSTQTAAIIAKDPAKYPGIWSTAPSYEGLQDRPAQPPRAVELRRHLQTAQPHRLHRLQRQPLLQRHR